MSDRGAPRHGRHATPDEGWGAESPSWGAGSSFWADEAPEHETSYDSGYDTQAWSGGAAPRDRVPSTAERAYRVPAPDSADWAPGGARRGPGLLERWPDETGPMPQARHRGAGDGGYDGGGHDDGGHGDGPHRDVPAQPARGQGLGGPADGHHPSGPLPPLPRSAWSKLRPRDVDDDDTAVQGSEEWDRTGGLEVIGAHVEEEAHRRGLFRRRGHAAHDAGLHDEAAHHDDQFLHDDVLHDDVLHDEDTVGSDAVHDGDIPIQPYDPRPHRRRKRRKRAALLVSLVVLAGLIGGVVIGGQRVWNLIVPADYSGSGTGSVQIRVTQGESLKAIGQTMVDKHVIASVRPFTKAAEANPNSTGIAPGIYGLRSHMSGQAALDLLLKPSSRLVSRVTLPEGLTAKQILPRLAQGTGVPLARLQAAAADTASLGLPAYANGSLEGFLFPATYDFEPGTTPKQMLQQMVTRTTQTLDELQIPAAQRLQVLTEASIVQAEAGSEADMPKVARVLDNRLSQGMPLQLDTTVNYANGKAGLTTTAQDRANPSPYNTYLHTGLPPGPISNPGEQALRAVLSPAQGNWLYFVVVNPDTGETRFAATAAEHQANVALFQQWLKAHPGG